MKRLFGEVIRVVVKPENIVQEMMRKVYLSNEYNKSRRRYKLRHNILYYKELLHYVVIILPL